MIETIANVIYHIADNDQTRHSPIIAGIFLCIIWMHLRAKSNVKQYKIQLIKHVLGRVKGYAYEIEESTVITREDELCLGYIVGGDYAEKYYQYCKDLNIEANWWPDGVRNIHKIRKEGLDLL